MKYDLFSIGEILIDMTPHNVDGKILYEANPGGAPFNVLTMANRFDIKTSFAGAVGCDGFGQDLLRLIKKEGIDTRFFKHHDHLNTSLAFVHLDKEGERSFSFFRESSADYQLDINPNDLIGIFDNFYFGSVALSKEPMATTIRSYLADNKSELKKVFFDPNYRPHIWPDEVLAYEAINSVLAYVDVLKVSEEEALFITGMKTSTDALDHLHGQGIEVIYMTLGKDGALLSRASKQVKLAPYPVNQVIDSTGAGDGFFGSVIGYLIERAKSKNLDMTDYITAGQYGTITGGLCVQGHGAIPSYPDLDRVKEVYGG